MHWVIQDGFFNETGMFELVYLLTQYNLPYTIVKVVPFVGEVIPDLDITGSVICFGSYSMRHTAAKKNWFPGVFDLDTISETIYTNKWSEYVLNTHARLCKFVDAPQTAKRMGLDVFFIRPANDSKVFAGNIYDIVDLQEWVESVVSIEDGDKTSLRADTVCLISKPKTIYSEYRLFVVGNKVVTASQYKINDTVCYSNLVDDDILQFGQWLVDQEPNFAEAYCLDLCRTPDGILIVEVNTINSAGFYHANVSKLIEAFEDLYATPIN